MAKVLPAPIDHFLLQADLTVMVPGPLDRGLAEDWRLSRRWNPRVRRWCTASPRLRSGGHSTPGGPRASCTHFSQAFQNPCAASFDVPDRRRRAQARTVAGRRGRILRPLRGSRAARSGGGPPAASSWNFACSRRPSRCRRRRSTKCSPRCGPRDSHLPPRTPPAPSSTWAAARGCLHPGAVAHTGHCPADRQDTLAPSSRCCARSRAAPRSMPTRPGRAMTQLQHAAHQQESVVIGYVDAAGIATQRVVAPINVRGGQLIAFDPASGRVREFAVHRVTRCLGRHPDNGRPT